MNRDIMLLDCTLRDGGMLFEGKTKPEDRAQVISEVSKNEIVKNLVDANVDIIEIGAIDMGFEDKKGHGIYRTIEDVSGLIPNHNADNTLFSVFINSPDIPIEKLPERNDSFFDLARLSIRYSELQRSLDYCKKLQDKGYLVSIQPIVTVRYSNDDLSRVLETANQMGAFAVYMVDSYGSMYPEDTRKLYHKYDAVLESNIRIGIHAHNNLLFALSNVFELIRNLEDRRIIIDSCCIGMGQGAGNLQTEIMIHYLNKYCGGNYDFFAVLRACEYVADFWDDNLWGYSLSAMIPAVYNAAYKYGFELRENHHYSYEKIAKTLEKLTDEMRFRYTEDYLKKITEGSN